MVVDEVVFLAHEKLSSCIRKPRLFYFLSIVASYGGGLSRVGGGTVVG